MIPGLVQRRRLANPRSTAAAAALNPAFAVTTPRRPAQAENEREKESKNLRNKAAKYNIINSSASKIGQNEATRIKTRLALSLLESTSRPLRGFAGAKTKPHSCRRGS
jgi:hypothetical protein